MTRLGKLLVLLEPKIYRLRSVRYNHYAIAPVVFWNAWLGIRLVTVGFRTDFDGFVKGNVGEQAGHIKKIHEDIRIDLKVLHGLSKRKQI